MSVMVLQVFVSLMLVLGSVLLFAYSVRQKDHEHADRLSLFPLDDEQTRPAAQPRDEATPPPGGNT
jgi:hypothetical protein